MEHLSTMAGLSRRLTRMIEELPPQGAFLWDWVMLCRACEISGSDGSDHVEALYLAGIHNDLHHGGNPVATAVPVQEPAQSERPPAPVPAPGVGGEA